MSANSSSANASNWPIEVSESECLPLCVGYSWKITNEALLAQYVARVMLGQAQAVVKVLEALEAGLPGPPATTAIDAAIARLAVPTNVQQRWRRDGWVFQTIAWLASWRRRAESELVRAPQIRPAEHGIDGLVVRVGTQPEGVRGVFICEQKATDDARSQIRTKVWPEIVRYESGERDDQLVAEVAALLEKQSPNTAIELASAIYWQDKRWYRVAVTVSEDQSREEMLTLFAGFENKAAGVTERRSGEVLPVGDVRAWMDQFCLKVAAELNALRPAGK